MTIFKSCLYHSLVKPADCSDESPFDASRDVYLDFATMWDMYKTQLPLVATIFPEQMSGIVNSFLNSAERTGKLPNCTLMAGVDAAKGCDMQARALACHSILDAFHCGVQDIDWHRALDVMAKDVFSACNDDFLKNGMALPITHTLDLASACDCIRQLADALGDSGLSVMAAEHTGKWLNAYNPETGLLKEGEYYEGTLWNYSFRLLHDMSGRIAVCGRNRFVSLLDSFFGYGATPVRQLSDYDERSLMNAYSLHRFEGLNNEPDMETPYAYIYAGRHDRTAEIVRAGMQFMFAAGRGGAPGNVDSGALSSWYVWNAIGLFPVAGQDRMLLGSPCVNSARVHLPQGMLFIDVQDNSPANIYVSSASWNGIELDFPGLKVSDMMRGGNLRFTMSSEPSGFGHCIL